MYEWYEREVRVFDVPKYRTILQNGSLYFPPFRYRVPLIVFRFSMYFFIKGRDFMWTKSCLPAFSIGKQCEALSMMIHVTSETSVRTLESSRNRSYETNEKKERKNISPLEIITNWLKYRLYKKCCREFRCMEDVWKFL